MKRGHNQKECVYLDSVDQQPVSLADAANLTLLVIERQRGLVTNCPPGWGVPIFSCHVKSLASSLT
jgi:hypothetical protein